MAEVDVLVVGGLFREIHEGVKRELRYAGSGLTAALTAARLGARVSIGGFVGDEDAETILSLLDADAIERDSLQILPGASGTFVFPREGDPARPWPIYRPAESTPIDVPQLPKAPSVVLTFGIPDFDPIRAGWLDVIEAGSILIWDQQGWLSRARDSSDVIKLRPRRKIELANEDEAAGRHGVGSLAEAVSREPTAGFTASVIKSGIAGVTVIERGVRPYRVASYPVVVRSSIGSGDIFAGAVSARLASHYSLSDAARWGCAAASVALSSGTGQLPRGSSDSVRALSES